MASLSDYEDLLKTQYPKARLEDLVSFDCPLYKILPKDPNFKGDSAVVPLHTRNTNRASSDFSTASNNTGTAGTNKFIITRQKDYGLASLDRETMMASEGNEAAFLSLFKFYMDDAIDAVGNSLKIKLYGSGSGKLGKISADSDTSGETIYLDAYGDCIKFQPGMVIQFSQTEGSGGLRDSGNTAEVRAVDPDLGTVTFTEPITSTVSGVSAGDTMYRKGDYAKGITGLAGWIPSVSPVQGDNFMGGVDRSVNPVILAGHRTTASGSSIRQDLIQLATKIGSYGGRPDYALLSFATWNTLANEISGSSGDIRYIDPKSGELNIPFETILLRAPGGLIRCVADTYCPDGVKYIIQSNVWKLRSLGQTPHIFANDGKMIRESGSDSYEVRVGYYAQLACEAPSWNGVCVG